MSRMRSAALAAASSLGLISGCANLSDHPMFSWLHHGSEVSGCCEGGCGGCSSCGDGPAIGEYGGGPVIGAPPGAVSTVPPMSSCQTPMLAPAPRLTPQPQVATPLPAMPSAPGP